jgi:transposase InsO family protein
MDVYVVPVFGRESQKMYTKRYECAMSARETASRKIERRTLLNYFPQRGPWNRFRWTYWDLIGPNTVTVFYWSSQTAIPRSRRLYRTVTALSVSRAICDHRAYVYGPPFSLLTDNGPQFTAKFFQAVCYELGIQKGFMTAYHPQTNGQVERYNRTILASL